MHEKVITVWSVCCEVQLYVTAVSVKTKVLAIMCIIIRRKERKIRIF